MRLCSVAQSLGGLLQAAQEAEDHPADTLAIESAVIESIERAMSEVLSATGAMAECAAALEATAAAKTPPGEDFRWALGHQEHYPELLTVEAPPRTVEPDTSDTAELHRVLSRCRLQIAAVKDRYTMVLPGLPWIGSEREDFTGPRLTKVRAQLEAAADALNGAVGADVEIDLTDQLTPIPVT